MKKNTVAKTSFVTKIIFVIFAAAAVYAIYAVTSNRNDKKKQTEYYITPTLHESSKFKPEITTSNQVDSKLTVIPTGKAGEILTLVTSAYQLTYPSDLVMEKDETGSIVNFDRQLYFTVTSKNPENCSGDCKIRETTTEKSIGGYTYKVVNGWVGSAGGFGPQRYLSYELKRNANYYVFTVYELKNTGKTNPNRSMGEVSEDKIQTVENILKTLSIK